MTGLADQERQHKQQQQHWRPPPQPPTVVVDLREVGQRLRQVSANGVAGAAGSRSHSRSRGRSQRRHKRDSASKSQSRGKSVLSRTGSSSGGADRKRRAEPEPPAATAGGGAPPPAALAETQPAPPPLQPPPLQQQQQAEPAAPKLRKSANNVRAPIDVERDRFPLCLVWAPLPVISWFLPVIGHTGVSDSRGVIHDFSDDYHVSVDNFSFGAPTKYYQFEPAQLAHHERPLAAWDAAVVEQSELFARTRHSFCFNNCHQYIAAVLNRVEYGRRADWTQRDVCQLITFYSTYTGCLGFIRQWWPLAVVLLALLVFGYLLFS